MKCYKKTKLKIKMEIYGIVHLGNPVFYLVLFITVNYTTKWGKVPPCAHSIGLLFTIKIYITFKKMGGYILFIYIGIKWFRWFRDPSETGCFVKLLWPKKSSNYLLLFKSLLQMNCCHMADSQTIFAMQDLLQFFLCILWGWGYSLVYKGKYHN